MSGSYAGTPGQGPGGGSPGLGHQQTGGDGKFASVYGNPYLRPLVGGSGGGGGGSDANAWGGNGGGGGGAILVASSRDMLITGSIQANGGSGFYPNGFSGGSGSGGGGNSSAMMLQQQRRFSWSHYPVAPGPHAGARGDATVVRAITARG